jgi:tape measure domain-containing protein
MITIRELVTKLAFKMDLNKLAEFDRRLGETRRKAQMLTENIEGVARGVRNAGLMMSAMVSLPLTMLSIKALKTASNLEQLDIAFTTMLGSAEKAKVLIKELLTFTAQTPFEIQDVQENAKLLLGMGIESEKIIPTLSNLGNVASGLSIPLERLAMNYGQVKTQGQLTGAELRDFNRMGVPLIKELSKVLGIQENQVKDWVSSGKAGFKDVEKAFMNMSGEGGKFFNLMQKQSKTLAGRWSNLNDAFTIMSAEFGKMIDETFNLRENISRLTKAVEYLTEKFKTMSPFWKKVIVYMTLATILIPILIALVGSLGLAIIGIKTAVFALLPLLKMIGITAGLGFGIILAKIILIIAAIAAIGFALWVVFDEIRTWVQGGDSLIGKLLGSFERFAQRVRLIWGLLKLTFGSLWDALTTGSQESWDKFKRFAGLLLSHIVNLVMLAFGKLAKMDIQLTEIIAALGKALLNLGWTIIKVAWTILKNGVVFMFTELENMLTDKLGNLDATIGNWLLKKFPRLGKMLLTDEFINSQKAGTGGLPKTTLPGGALALAGNGGGGSKEVNINSKVMLEVPAGTTEQQERYLYSTADALFDRKLNEAVGTALNANPQVEE